MITQHLFRGSSVFLAICMLLLFSACKAPKTPEQSLVVGSTGQTNSPAQYKPKTSVSEKVRRHFNTMYSPLPYESEAYFNDYNFAKATSYQKQLDKAIQDYIDGKLDSGRFEALKNVVLTQRQAQRNDFLFKYMKVISRNYATYSEVITGGKATFDLVSDTLIIAGTTVAAAVGPATTKTLWSLAVAAFTGAKLSADKNLFLNHSILLLAARMEQNRVEKRNEIRLKMRKSIDDYTISEAALDLQELYEAGSLLKVLENIAVNQTGSNQTTSVTVSTPAPITPAASIPVIELTGTNGFGTRGTNSPSIQPAPSSPPATNAPSTNGMPRIGVGPGAPTTNAAPANGIPGTNAPVGVLSPTPSGVPLPTNSPVNFGSGTFALRSGTNILYLNPEILNYLQELSLRLAGGTNTSGSNALSSGKGYLPDLQQLPLQ
jgi:hypothetical protein